MLVCGLQDCGSESPKMVPQRAPPPRIHALLLSFALGSGLALALFLPIECGGRDAE